MLQPPPLPPPHSTLLVGITSGRCAGCAATSSAALQAKRDGSARHSAALGAQLRQPAPPWWHSGSHQAATIGRMTCFKLGGGKPRKCNLKKRISHSDKNLLTRRTTETLKQRSLCSAAYTSSGRGQRNRRSWLKPHNKGMKSFHLRSLKLNPLLSPYDFFMKLHIYFRWTRMIREHGSTSYR